MNAITPLFPERAEPIPLNLSRRGFVGALGTLVLGFSLPSGPARAQGAAAVAPGTRVRAFLEIRPDSTVLFRSPFIEGGQGVFTAMAQIVGEELDVEPARFVVEGAPPGAAATARSTSAALPRLASAKGFSVAGSTSETTRGLTGSTQRPSM